jgi:hypothetical protein
MGVEDAPVTKAPPAFLLLRFGFIALLALGLVAVLWMQRDTTAGKVVTTKYGVTTQGRQFKLGIDGKGRTGSFATEVAAICPTGTTIAMPWDPTDGDPAPFERHGDRLHVAERGDGWALRLDARVNEHGGLRGTVRLDMHLTPKGHAPVDCSSKDIGFSAGL